MAGDVQPTLTCLTPPSHVPMCGEDPPLPLVAVRGSFTPLVVLSTTRCVGESLATSWEIQTLSLVLDCQLTPTMSMHGVSVTHGTPHQHIWIFSNGLDELSTSNPYATCPCVTGSTNGPRIPSFVGQNYFCETGLTRCTVKTFGLLQPYFGHLSCMSVVCMTHYKTSKECFLFVSKLKCS